MASVVGIDIGGTKMLAGLVTPQGDVLATERRPTRAASYLDDVEALATAMVAIARARGLEVEGIGVGTTGMVDHAQGVLTRSLGLGLREVPIRARLEAALDLPASVDNDIHAAALGELYFGIGRRYADFLLLNAGTGLSAGLVFGGRLHRGATNTAGEIGHTSVWPEGPACRCGLPGCVETLVVRAREGGPVPDVHLPSAGAPAPDPAFGYLALAAINLVNALNPAAIALAGGMFTSDPAGTAWFAEAVRRCSLAAASAGLEHLAVSSAGAQAGLLGAAALVLERLGDRRRFEGLHA